MKTNLQILYAAFLFAAGFSSTPAESASNPQVVVELRDGSRVVGQNNGEKLEFRSEIFGEIKLPVEQIGSIDFLPKTNAVKLVAANGDKLAVLFVTKEIHVETSFGKILIPAASIRRLQVTTAETSGMPKAGLVALWSAEGDANDSVGDRNGQLVNEVGFAPGKVGQAFDFNEGLYSYAGIQTGFGRPGIYQGQRLNRGGGFILIPANQALDVGKGGGLTFAFWVKPSTINAEMMLFEFERELGTFDGADVGVNFEIQPAGPGGVLYANLEDNEGSTHVLSTPPASLKQGVWQHIALTYDRDSGKAVIYVNGTTEAEDNLGKFTPQTSFTCLLLGARTTFNSSTRPGDLFSGGLDEFGIYNRALSAAEIQAIYESENNDALAR